MDWLMMSLESRSQIGASAVVLGPQRTVIWEWAWACWNSSPSYTQLFLWLHHSWDPSNRANSLGFASESILS